MNEQDLINFKLNLKKRLNGITHVTPKLTKGEWIHPGKIVEMGLWSSDRGLFYFGHRLCGLDNYSTEPSLINPDSTVNYDTPNNMGYGMSYWPSYHTLSPESRAGYLKWLLGSRSEPDAYIGYVFIYFYGLERRVLIDKSDYITVKEELLRLKNIYSHPSFQTHVNHLLLYLNVILEVTDPNQEEKVILDTPNYLNPWFNYIMATKVKNGEPLGSELSLRWYFNHPEVRLKTPVTRCREFFNQLFYIRFNEFYPKGIIIKENKKRYRPEYQPANLTLRGYRPNEIEDLPAVTNLKAPFTKVLNVAEQVISELESYSRYLGRNSNSSDHLLGLIHLPNELGNSITNSKYKVLMEFIERQLHHSPLIPLSEILSYYGLEEPERVGKRELSDLRKLLELSGYGLVPFDDHHSYQWDKTDLIGLVEQIQETSVTKHYYKVLGVCIVISPLLPVEKALLISKLREIVEEAELSKKEKQILKTYILWIEKTRKFQINLKTIKLLNTHEKSLISGLLVDLSLIDGSIDNKKRKELENLYKRVEIGLEQLDRDIDSRRINTFTLDRDILKIHEEETADVQEILEHIFVSEEDESITEPSQEVPLKIGLEKSYFYLYNSIVEREEWSLEEFSKLCSDLKLLPGGAIEVINDWSYDLVDAPLIEEGDPVYIDLEIYEELQCILKG